MWVNKHGQVVRLFLKCVFNLQKLELLKIDFNNNEMKISVHSFTYISTLAQCNYAKWKNEHEYTQKKLLG